MKDFDLSLDIEAGYFNDEPIPVCHRCGLQLECSYELSSGLCWICEKQPQPLEEEQP